MGRRRDVGAPKVWLRRGYAMAADQKVVVERLLPSPSTPAVVALVVPLADIDNSAEATVWCRSHIIGVPLLDTTSVEDWLSA
jgi:hypothetical protein